MKFRIVFFIAALSLPVFAQETKPGIDSLGWLAGCWESKNEEKNMLITEQWMKPAGGVMIGAGRTVMKGKTVDYEFLRIIEDIGSIFYVAKPTANKEETRFKLIKATPSEIIFENPAHDFPQRVMYRLDGMKLNARIEGTKDGKPRGVDFPYGRVKCD